MTPEDLLYIKSSLATGRREADAHYAKLHAFYLETIPACFRIEQVSLESRPPGFNADVNEFIFYMNIGECYANTFAVFEFASKKSAWKLRHYVSQISIAGFGFGVKQQISRSLPAAIITSSELWQEAKKDNANANGPAPGQLAPVLLQ